MPKQITATIPSGIYRIVNVRSYSSVRCYQAGPIYVRSTLEFPGTFELWQIGDDGSIKNVGLNLYVSIDSSGKAVTGPNQDTFTFESAGDDGDNIYFISTGDSARRARDAGKVWNADPPVIPVGNISVQDRTGDDVQLFRLLNVQD